MKAQILQHVPFETPGNLLSVFELHGIDSKIVHLYQSGFQFENDHDILVIMGGPMNIYEENIYPWLRKEKELISKDIHSGKIVIGFCLGAQLIADSLGARVYKNIHPEIGWFPVKKNQSTSLMGFLPEFVSVFHWHGETFDLPERSIHLYSSEATKNQAFLYEERVLGLQFHLEVTRLGVEDLINHCSDELVKSPYVSTSGKMLSDHELYETSNYRILNRLIQFFKA